MLRTLAIVSLIGVVLGTCVLAIWAYGHRRELACRWAARRVARAANPDAARKEIAWFETDPDRPFKLQQLVRAWGSGDRQFDLYLAQHLGDANCPNTLREAFSLECAWREDVLPRWTHYWLWRCPEEPDRQVAQIVSYLDLLASADPPRRLTWREVLDLQAIFQLAGEPQRALRLKPDQWRERFREWRRAHPGALPHVARPESEFPEETGHRALSRSGLPSASLAGRWGDWRASIRATICCLNSPLVRRDAIR
jgi:hypothetical protein